MINEPGKKPQIMIVEDELIVAQNIENQLRKLGYNVPNVSSSGQEAISFAYELKPDLVLMDIKLSGTMDGIEAANYINSNFHIPIVYLTAYADNETLQRAKISDPYGYIIKPFEIKKLHTTIEIALYKAQIGKKLKESELRFRTLAESSPVGIFETDIDGKCIYVNRRWCEITGIPPKQAYGAAWVSSLHPDDRLPVTQAWESMANSTDPFMREYRFITPDTKTTWVVGHITPLSDDKANKRGYIGTVTDITPIKKLEEELLTSKKLESIGILAGGIAHDFNNLLSVILGTISVMKEDAGLGKYHLSLLESMENASLQASDLAQKLITFSKGGWLNRKKIDVKTLLVELIDQNFSINGTPIEINIDIPAYISRIDGDCSQLKQVFSNLILNAVEASKKYGEITITAENVVITEKNNADLNKPLKPGEYIKISIKDSGQGIEKENLAKIFDPYFTTKEKGSKKGLGLGMTICYSIVQKHGGLISVKSEKNIGTTVDVYLPKFCEDIAPGKNASSISELPKRILLMDDEPIVQDVTSRMLERLGYEVIICEEGQQAIDAFNASLKNENPFDFLFLDIMNKKGLGGKAALKKILSVKPSTKIIGISGFADALEVDVLKKEGFTDVLLKPFKLGDLKHVLDKNAG